MRRNNKIIQMQQIVDVQTTNEDIANYYVNKNNKIINVTVSLFDEELSFLLNEYYTFGENEYVENPTEMQLWSLVDEQRKNEI